MILHVLNSTIETKPKSTTQILTAKYEPTRETTTISYDLDIVTLGILATFLTAQYAEEKRGLTEDVQSRLDNTINNLFKLEE